MNSFKKVLARLFWSESQHAMVLTPDADASFHVNLGKLLIGTLMYSDGVWYFSYSDSFKAQNTISPLANFPSKEKEYTTTELWPFFASRIPSGAQLQVDKSQPTDDVVTLLKKFGRRTIANPYELRPVNY